MSAGHVLFTILFVCALGFFAANLQRLIGELQLGRTDDDRWNHLPTRFGNFLRIGIFQEKIFRDSIAGPMHAAIDRKSTRLNSSHT